MALQNLFPTLVICSLRSPMRCVRQSDCWPNTLVIEDTIAQCPGIQCPIHSEVTWTTVQYAFDDRFSHRLNRLW